MAPDAQGSGPSRHTLRGLTAQTLVDRSDRLVDSAVAWGSETTIRARMEEHRDAGASHIIVSALNPEGGGPPWKFYEAFAP